MALNREAFINLRQEDGTFKELTLSNFGYETISDFNKVDTERNYWFTTTENPANKPPASNAWNYTGFIMNYVNPVSQTLYTKIVCFEVGLNSNFYIRGRTSTDNKWGQWHNFKPYSYNSLTGDEILMKEDIPVTIPEIQ